MPHFGGTVPLKLMIFDLWGTLFLSDGPNEGPPREGLRRRMVHEALAPLGERFDDDHMDRAFAAAGAELSGIHQQHRDISAEARTVLYMRHLDDGLPDRLDDAAWERLHRAVLTPALELPPVPMPGAIETLEAVKALGVPTCLISNAGITPGFVLREVLDRYGMLAHLDHTVFSDEVELSKPAAAIFERALDEFGVAADAAAFLGDQPVLDVLGPQAVGIWTVQIGDIAEDGIAPHARIDELSGLVPALGSLGLL